MSGVYNPLQSGSGISIDFTTLKVNVEYDSTLQLNGSNQIGLNLGHANTWTGEQTFSGGITIPYNSGLPAGASNLQIGATADFNTNTQQFGIALPAGATNWPFQIFAGGGTGAYKQFYVSVDSVVGTKNNILDNGSGNMTVVSIQNSSLGSSYTAGGDEALFHTFTLDDITGAKWRMHNGSYRWNLAQETTTAGTFTDILSIDTGESAGVGVNTYFRALRSAGLYFNSFNSYNFDNSVYPQYGLVGTSANPNGNKWLGVYTESMIGNGLWLSFWRDNSNYFAPLIGEQNSSFILGFANVSSSAHAGLNANSGTFALQVDPNGALYTGSVQNFAVPDNSSSHSISTRNTLDDGSGNTILHGSIKVGANTGGVGSGGVNPVNWFEADNKTWNYTLSIGQQTSITGNGNNVSIQTGQQGVIMLWGMFIASAENAAVNLGVTQGGTYYYHYVSEVVQRSGSQQAMVDGVNNSGNLGYAVYVHAVINVSDYQTYDAAIKNISGGTLEVYSYNIVAIGL